MEDSTTGMFVSLPLRQALAEELEIFRGRLRQDLEGMLSLSKGTTSSPPSEQIVKTDSRIPSPHQLNEASIRPRMLPNMLDTGTDVDDDELSAIPNCVSENDKRANNNEASNVHSKSNPELSHEAKSSAIVRSVTTSDKLQDRMNMFERSAKEALGFTVRKVSHFDEKPGTSHSRQKVAVLIRSDMYELFSVCLVLAYAVFIGWQVDYCARHQLEVAPTPFRTADLVFLFLFAGQIALSFFAFRLKFFYMWGWGWNIFDLVLVTLQCVEEVATSISGMQNLEVLRIFRLFRTARSLRIVRLLQQLSALRLLVICIVESFRSFLYVVLLVGTLIYIASIGFTQSALHTIVASKNQEGKTQAIAEVSHFFGTLFRTILSLSQGLTGGLDWNDLFEPLYNHVGPWTGSVFVAWTLFGILAIMNVVTGIFIEHAIAQGDAIKSAHRLERARKMFKQLDLDGSKSITLEELKDCLMSPVVYKFFAELGVQPKHAYLAFECFDVDGSGCVELDEFLNGCNRLQSSAQFGDLMFVYSQLQSNMVDQQRNILSVLEQQFTQAST